MRILVLALVLAACGCGGGGKAPTGAEAARIRTAAVDPAGPAAVRKAREDEPPAADAPIPRSVAALTDALRTTTRSVEADVRAWLRTHPPIGAKPPESIALRALYQQRIYRYLRRHPALAEKVVAALPGSLRVQARDNVGAGRSLLELSPKTVPRSQPPIHTGTAEAPQRLLAWYRQAQRRFGVRWQILAAVNLVESGFNRLRNNSYAGAQGPMQFIPSTWGGYGLGGDIRDPHDAIMGAGNYLHASGAPGDYRRAIYSYNPSPLYVDAIMRYARQMSRRPERFYVYWDWQVFVRTRSGADRRLTGPGLNGSSGASGSTASP